MRSQLKNKKIGPASPPITNVPHLGKTLQPAHNATVPINKKKSRKKPLRYQMQNRSWKQKGAGLS